MYTSITRCILFIPKDHKISKHGAVGFEVTWICFCLLTPLQIRRGGAPAHRRRAEPGACAAGGGEDLFERLGVNETFKYIYIYMYTLFPLLASMFVAKMDYVH